MGSSGLGQSFLAGNNLVPIIDEISVVGNMEPLGVVGGSLSLTGSAGRAEPLGNNTKLVSGEARKRRYALQDAAAKLLPGERVSWCGKMLVSGAKTVEVCTHGKQAYYKNLAACGSVWTCPVCASKIAARRREELARALSDWAGGAVMLTLTLQHSRDDDLAELLTALKDVWRRMKGGRFWRDIKSRYKIEVCITATEVTWGSAAGWHPHLHVLIFSGLPEHKFDRASFKNELNTQYLALLDAHGRYASEYYGINVRVGDDKAGSYISKYGLDWELTHSNIKKGVGGLSPFELLEKYSEGHYWAGLLFQEYAAVFAHHKQLNFSRGARALLGLEPGQEDDELAAEELQDGDLLLELTISQFNQVVRAGKRAELLDQAAGGDAWQVWQYLQDELKIIPELWQAERFMVWD